MSDFLTCSHHFACASRGQFRVIASTSRHRLSVLITKKQKKQSILCLSQSVTHARTNMISLARFLPLLVVASTPLCSSFAPSNPSISIPRAQISTQHPRLQAAASGETENQNKVHVLEDDVMERVGKATASALVALTLSFFAITAPVPFSGTLSSVPFANAADSAIISAGPSITIASTKSTSDDDATIKYLEQETRLAEKEAKADAQKARVEKSRESFFDYDAKMAAQAEARIEAAEQRTLLEAKTDKELAEKLKVREQKAEKEAALATTPKEKAAKQKEARELLKLEKLAERKEKEAERAERIFLAEEEQERKILKQKTDAALAVRTATVAQVLFHCIVPHQRPISFTHTGRQKVRSRREGI